jgi:hypothetical protein
MEDANRILEQRALRNVRALVEKLEASEPAHIGKLLLLVGLAVVIGGFALWASGSRKAAVDAAHRQQLACELDIWVVKSSALIEGFRQAHPGMPYLDIEKLLERERPAVMAAAKAQCDARSSQRAAAE